MSEARSSGITLESLVISEIEVEFAEEFVVVRRGGNSFPALEDAAVAGLVDLAPVFEEPAMADARA